MIGLIQTRHTCLHFINSKTSYILHSVISEQPRYFIGCLSLIFIYSYSWDGNPIINTCISVLFPVGDIPRGTYMTTGQTGIENITNSHCHIRTLYGCRIQITIISLVIVSPTYIWEEVWILRCGNVNPNEIVQLHENIAAHIGWSFLFDGYCRGMPHVSQKADYVVLSFYLMHSYN